MGRFPGHKAFAFTVFDDTDGSTLQNVEPVYRLLAELGLRTTKSVWPLALVPGQTRGGSTGDTLQDPAYLAFVCNLRDQGFEIALHGVRNHDATRELVEQGIDEFCELIGGYPRVHTNHYRNREGVYWGTSRLSSEAGRSAARIWSLLKKTTVYEGHIENSPYFWGDVCKQHISYVRNFTVDEINILRFNPTLPYHDSTKPFVNFWFSSCEGATVTSFCQRICEANQDRLEAEGGVCIMYTHFAEGFSSDGIVNRRFEALLRRLARKDGYFVPVAETLDFLQNGRTDFTISPAELSALERRWLRYKLRYPRTR